MIRFLTSVTKVALALFAAVLIASGTAKADASLPDPHVWTGGSNPPLNQMSVFWAESTLDSSPVSYSPFDERTSVEANRIVGAGFDTVLGPCSDTLQIGCISAMKFSLDDGTTWSDAKRLTSPGQRDFAFNTISPTGKQDTVYTSLYSADSRTGLLESSLPNFWNLPGATNALGEEYMINVVARSALQDGKAKLTELNFSANAGKQYPVSAPCKYLTVQTQRTGGFHGYCFEPVNLPSNLRLRVSVNLGDRIDELSGWFDGRLEKPVIDFGSTQRGVVTVEGLPIEVNYVQTRDIAKGESLYTVTPSVEALQVNSGTHWVQTSRTGLDDFLKYSAAIPQTASARNTVWRMSSWNANGIDSDCSSSPGVKGVVISNATTYDAVPPRFDPKSGGLDFRVASAHRNPDGTLASGVYRLYLQQKLAKCLWGEETSGSASVSVVDEDGVQEVAYSSMGVSNGWLHFEASGFHYSAPKISVKMIKSAPVASPSPSPSASPSPTTSPSVSPAPNPTPKKTTISCVKGKTTKKVTAVSPKCPAGYKKKA